MVTVSFTANLRRHVDCPRMDVQAGSLRQVLERVFAEHAHLKHYVLDDQGGVRDHVAIFIDNQAITERRQLGQTVADGQEVFVMQALSGG